MKQWESMPQAYSLLQLCQRPVCWITSLSSTLLACVGGFGLCDSQVMPVISATSDLAYHDSTSCLLSSLRNFADCWSSSTCQHDRITWIPSSVLCSVTGLNESLRWWFKGAERDQVLAALTSTGLVCSGCKTSRKQFQSKHEVILHSKCN